MIDWKRTVALRAGGEDINDALRLFTEMAERALWQGVPPEREALLALAKAARHLGLSELACLCDETMPGDETAPDIKAIQRCYEMSKAVYLTGLTAHAPTARRFVFNDQIRNSARISSSVMSR